MLAGQVLSALRARGQATLDATAAHAAGSSPRLCYELEEAVDPVHEGPGERPPLGPGLPPSIHASGVDCWSGLVERLRETTDVVAVIHSLAWLTSPPSTYSDALSSREASSRSALRRPSSASFSTGQSSISAASRCEHQAKASCSSGSSVGSLCSVTSAPNATT